DPTAGEKPSGGRVQSFRDLPDDHEVDLARLPNLLEVFVDLMEDVRVELRRPDVRVQIEAEPQAEDDAHAREISVRQGDVGKADGPKEDGVGGFAGLERTVRPLGPGVHVGLTGRGKGEGGERKAGRDLDGKSRSLDSRHE